ncbi:hypothetical protein M2407_001051 [Serratia sp. BIGb0234]|uniref:hypothetical protein n=1 Tax=Serratia sp. BIGb0234 TaxID=2940614 RepID=UPI002169A88E|nr:hypothetical protein [Serratia sp. BIGb0234]MCS4316752.1 hypothetical protein [Serratia sp. BIGb0234]
MKTKISNISLIEVLTLFFSCTAVWISWNGQNYVEAAYISNKKLIVYSERYKDNPEITKLIPIGDNKKILSVRISYPDKFIKNVDYIDASGLYASTENININIARMLKKDIKDNSISFSIPVELLTKYAVDGDVFYDNSIYFITYKINLEKEKDSNYKVITYESQFEFASRIPDSITYSLIRRVFGEDETMDINKMFETNSYWSSLDFVRSL